MSTLNVYLYEKQIGTINLLPGELNLFSFSDSYINNENRPTFSMSFKEKISGGLIQNIRPTKVKLTPFFSNLLPEGHLREYLAAAAGVNSEREFFLLRALGWDLPGAVTVRAPSSEGWPEDVITDHSDHLKKESLRFSLAGVQLKFSALAETSGGLTIPAHGVGGQWILKLPSARFPQVPENEYSMLTLAKAVGIEVPDIKLVSLNEISGLPKNVGKFEGNVLAIKRFDRATDGSIHIEDFAQVFGIYPNEKYSRINYKNIAEVLWAETGLKGLTEFIRRLVFSALIGNADMHAKNWSLIYRDRVHAELSPAYDFVSTIAYLEDEEMALNLVKSKKMRDLNQEQLAYFASKVKCPEAAVLNTARETVQGFREVWSREKKHLALPPEMITLLDKHLKSLPLMKE